MPHKHRPRKNKALNMLLESENNDLIIKSIFDAERDNLVSKTGSVILDDVKSVIYDRWYSAEDVTANEARKMEEMDRLYYGVFEDGKSRDGHMFLNKTRENVKTIHSYLLQLASQLTPMISCMPKVANSIHAAEGQFRRAKVMEALLNFQFDDVWNFRDDVLPTWIKHFLKYSGAYYKISYKEDNYNPDINIEVVDRAFLRVDPIVRDIKDARWLCEDQFISRTKVKEMVDHGYWDMAHKEIDSLPSARYTFNSRNAAVSTSTINRVFGQYHENTYSSVNEDDLIHIIHYYQADKDGLDDVYSVMAGGIDGKLVRHGRNPFPYKGIPFRGKSYDPDESKMDGVGLIEETAPIQNQINNLLELRNKDIQNNVYSRKIVPENMVDSQTMEDWEDGHQLLRGNKEFFDSIKDDPSFDINKYVFDLGIRPSTDNIFAGDLQFHLNQLKENSFVSDVFRGQASQTEATFGQIREQLSRNQGAFRPVYLQMMRAISEVAEICVSFYQSPEFFPVERVIQVVGDNKYADVIGGWHNPAGTDMYVRQVTADELDVEVTIDTVSMADAVASRSLKNTQIAELLQAIGQIPGAFEKVDQDYDMAGLIGMIIENNGADLERIKLNPQQKQEKEQAKQQQIQQQQQMLMQQQEQLEMLKRQTQQENAQLEMQKQQVIQQSRAQAQTAIDQNKGQINMQATTVENDLETKRMQLEIALKEAEKLKADIVRMNHEQRLERGNPGVSVGDGNIN